ncbi:selenoprotein S-like [Liolophura sinensis]|uniref:selenoprotein S-like n=1 Tax=Liolophura sinensis TaxID=3198878 RepID=UPI003158013D
MDAQGREAGEAQQPPPPPMSPSTSQIVLQVLEQYGWFLLLGAILIYFFWGKLEQKFRQFQEKQEEKNLKKYDSNTAQRRLESMAAARQRLQEKYDSEARVFAEHQRKKEEEKRKERIDDWDRHLEGKGYRNKFKPPRANMKSIKSSVCLLVI